MNHVFGRIAIGTANWGKIPYGLSDSCVPEDEQKRILDYCQCSGIDMLDTAIVYGWDWSNVSTYFNIVTKGDGNNKDFPRKPYAFLAHTGVIWQSFWDKTLHADAFKIGLSIYEPKEIPNEHEYMPDVIQVPYSIYDRRFESYFYNLRCKGIEIHVRSIFLQGKILEKYSPRECIDFCLMNRYVDRVIVGIDNLQQLKDNFRHLHRMNSGEVKDENILDPRRWSRRQ